MRPAAPGRQPRRRRAAARPPGRRPSRPPAAARLATGLRARRPRRAAYGPPGPAPSYDASMTPPEGAEALREVHIVTFPSAEAFAAYRDDPALAPLAPLRAASVLSTEVWAGHPRAFANVAGEVAGDLPAFIDVSPGVARDPPGYASSSFCRTIRGVWAFERNDRAEGRPRRGAKLTLRAGPRETTTGWSYVAHLRPRLIDGRWHYFEAGLELETQRRPP